MNEKKTQEILFWFKEIISKSDFDSKIGLINGEAGKVLFLYSYAGHFGDLEVYKLASDKLEKLMDEKIQTFNYIDGIFGIGILIQILSNERYISVEDDFFDEIDKTNSIELNIGYQTLMSFYSFQNEKDSSLRYELLSAPYKQYDHLTDYSKLNPQDAKKYLLSLAETKKIILLNEKHNRSTSREFLASMLRELKEKGYSILALEDLTETFENLISRGYPIKNSGFYIVEYNYANLIRLAMNLGFEVISYDATKSKHRSKDSFSNIKESLDQKPNAKMIILGGYGYNYKETITVNEAPRIGTLLYKEFGDSLLSVDCITFNNMFLEAFQSPLYKYLSDTMKVNIPSVLYNCDTLIYPDRISKTLIDFSVFFPKEFSLQQNRNEGKIFRKRSYNIIFYEVYLTHEFEKEGNLAIPVYMNKLKGLNYKYPKEKGSYIIFFYNKFNKVVLIKQKKNP